MDNLKIYKNWEWRTIGIYEFTTEVVLKDILYKERFDIHKKYGIPVEDIKIKYDRLWNPHINKWLIDVQAFMHEGGIYI